MKNKTVVGGGRRKGMGEGAERMSVVVCGSKCGVLWGILPHNMFFSSYRFKDKF